MGDDKKLFLNISQESYLILPLLVIAISKAFLKDIHKKVETLHTICFPYFITRMILVSQQFCFGLFLDAQPAPTHGSNLPACPLDF